MIRTLAATFIGLALAAALPPGAARAQAERPGGADSRERENLLYMDIEGPGMAGGRVEIRLRPDLAPAHVARIKALTRQGFYDGIIFHRVIEGFMAQTGDPTGTGRGGSGQKIEAEFTQTPYRRGSVGMARSRHPDSADSQFFICFDDSGCRGLTGQYTLFGEVVAGMRHIDAIPRGQPPAEPARIARLRVAADVEGEAGETAGE